MPAGVAYLGKLIVDAVVAALDGESRPVPRPTIARVLVVRRARRVARRGAGGRAARHRFLPVAAARAAVAARALLDSRQGADAVARAIRGLGVLRQVESRAARGVGPPAVAREPHVRARAERRRRSRATRACCSHFSPWAVAILVAAGLPAFVAETKFSGERFRAFQWRSPDRRMLGVSRDRARARGPRERGQAVRPRPAAARALSRDLPAHLRRGEAPHDCAATAGASCSGSSAARAFYGAYAWIALATIDGAISLGEMTMYLLLFKQGQSAVAAMLSAIGGMYEDNLYLSNLYDYLEQPSGRRARHGDDGHRSARRHRVRRRDVHLSRRRPCRRCAIVTLRVRPGQSVALVGSTARARRRS